MVTYAGMVKEAISSLKNRKKNFRPYNIYYKS